MMRYTLLVHHSHSNSSYLTQFLQSVPYVQSWTKFFLWDLKKIQGLMSLPCNSATQYTFTAMQISFKENCNTQEEIWKLKSCRRENILNFLYIFPFV